MRELILFDGDSLVDLVKILRMVLSRIKRLEAHNLKTNTYGYLKAVSLTQLTCYEKHKDFYRFIFYDKTTADYDYRVGRNFFYNEIPRGFIQINRNDVVNMSYIKRVDLEGVYLINEKKKKKIGETYKEKFYETLSEVDRTNDKYKGERYDFKTC